ncbi:amino acid permease [Kocuria indica]|uniref:Amino acid permease n=1 Tax=Kocuria marina subsp. indica TaxID=1049583 RepID=A0A6N9QWA0_9MICC|nr:amino acid permease [Kocuria indica]NDO76947.1 amino acid permease [Kocuria indica]
MTNSSTAVSPPHTHSGPSRGLSNRHIQLIAIGGAIGTGLFMGSGRTISLAGPAVVFVYVVIGFFLFFMMRAMGELLLSNLRYKTFADFAADLIGPWAGFFVGWSYWFCWIVTAIAELVAITGYVQFWWAAVPLWLPTVLVVVIVFLLNAVSVKNFGEMEFWFALIKIVAILALIVVGAIMALTHFTSPDGHTAQLANLWNDGGWFPHGAMGVVAGFQIAVFAFVGIELVGTTAAEARDPRTTLPRAINSVPVRILIFYVGSLLAILVVTPWRSINPEQSPFVAMFALAGLAGAASVVNFVVLTSAMSSSNSGVFSTSRMMFGLSAEGSAPGTFKGLNRVGVPVRALYLTAGILLLTIPVLYAGDSIIEAFTLITSVASLLFVFVWSMILISYIRYRMKFPERHAASEYKMPGGVVMCAVVLAFFAFVVWALSTDPQTATGLVAVAAWLVVLGIAWAFVRRTESHRQTFEWFKQEMAGSAEHERSPR